MDRVKVMWASGVDEQHGQKDAFRKVNVNRSSSELSDVFTESTASDDSECEQKKPLLLWDWDDTIFCTSHFARNKVCVTAEEPEISDELLEELADYEKVVDQTFDLVQNLGRVVIVTNAERGWVELTCARFFPTLYLKHLPRLEIVSARTTYESCDVRSPLQWKLMAFRTLVLDYLGDAALTSEDVQVLSFGDSAHEREALFLTQTELLSSSHTNQTVRMKSLKLIERPDIAALKKQHLLMHQCLIPILDHSGSLDLCIQSSCQAPSTPSTTSTLTPPPSPPSQQQPQSTDLYSSSRN